MTTPPTHPSTPAPPATLRRRAAAFIRREFGAAGLRWLGAGLEGVALTDGARVYKYFHDRERVRRGEWPAFLQARVGAWRGYASLYPLLAVRRRGDEAALVYPYEPSEPYAGGRLDDMLTFLRECRAAGIVCRNVHPDNFIVAGGALKFIDYGEDIREYSEGEFTHMCRRAFLSYRFHFRSDLKPLMTRALTDFGMPELAEFDRFMRALDPRGKEELLDAPLLERILALNPKSVLDYGGGMGNLADALASRVVQVDAYDADAAPPAYGQGKRDVVICSLVLCEIANQADFEQAIADLRRLTSEQGKAVVALCNPFHTFTERSELQRRILPATARYGDTFAHRKAMASTGKERVDIHRPLDAYRRAFTGAGFTIESVSETDGTDVANLWPSSDFLIFTLKPVPAARPRVSLLIKTCYMDWRIVERLVRHQVKQLEQPGGFAEKIVVVDNRLDGFNRQYDDANPTAHNAAMERLLADGVVDKVIYAPDDERTIRETYRRWFGASAGDSHSTNGQQVFATLHGFDACRADYVLQTDYDMLIGRLDAARDYIADMVAVLAGDPKALFAQLPIHSDADAPYTAGPGDGGAWRVEPRLCIFDRKRLQAALPAPNESRGDTLRLAWHRAFDRLIAQSDWRNYRGGRKATFAIHIPNAAKSDYERLCETIDRVEQGFIPRAQLGEVELAGGADEWAGPKRTEPFVFVICGRNVPPGRFKRCWDSVISQSLADWGAIIIDDASNNGLADYAAMLTAPYANKVTLIRNAERRGLMRNTWEAITRYCADPSSVIITLDADDALIGADALARVRREYARGADCTIGSMLRLDKQADYPPALANPRANRGGNVWQHLRTFRKRLFDAIAVDDLKLDGEWIDLANDWAYMLPIVEMASAPVHIPAPLYLHQPSTPKDAAALRRRDANIARIVGKRRYAVREG